MFGFLDATAEINTKGVGLGLYICKRIVTIFGGEVSVTSRPNFGSTFTFTFQLEELTSQIITIQRIFNPRAKTNPPEIHITKNIQTKKLKLNGDICSSIPSGI